MAFKVSPRGYLCVNILSMKRSIGVCLLFIITILASTKDIAGDPVIPDWFRIPIIICCAISAIWLLWIMIYGPPLEFDTHRKCLVCGQQIVARFVDVDHIEISEERVRRVFYETVYRIHIYLKGSRKIDLGYQKSQMDASETAAKIADLVDKPVRFI